MIIYLEVLSSCATTFTITCLSLQESLINMSNLFLNPKHEKIIEIVLEFALEVIYAWNLRIDKSFSPFSVSFAFHFIINACLTYINI